MGNVRHTACLVEVKVQRRRALDTCGRSRGRIPLVSAVRRGGGRRVRAGSAAECGGVRRSAECCDLFTPAALRRSGRGVMSRSCFFLGPVAKRALRLESTFRFLHRQLLGSFLFLCVCPSLELHSGFCTCSALQPFDRLTPQSPALDGAHELPARPSARGRER